MTVFDIQQRKDARNECIVTPELEYDLNMVINRNGVLKFKNKDFTEDSENRYVRLSVGLLSDILPELKYTYKKFKDKTITKEDFHYLSSVLISKLYEFSSIRDVLKPIFDVIENDVLRICFLNNLFDWWLIVQGTEEIDLNTAIEDFKLEYKNYYRNSSFLDDHDLPDSRLNKMVISLILEKVNDIKALSNSDYTSKNALIQEINESLFDRVLFLCFKRHYESWHKGFIKGEKIDSDN